MVLSGNCSRIEGEPDTKLMPAKSVVVEVIPMGILSCIIASVPLICDEVKTSPISSALAGGDGLANIACSTSSGSRANAAAGINTYLSMFGESRKSPPPKLRRG